MQIILYLTQLGVSTENEVELLNITLTLQVMFDMNQKLPLSIFKKYNDVQTGVYQVINKVFLKPTKETLNACMSVLIHTISLLA